MAAVTDKPAVCWDINNWHSLPSFFQERSSRNPVCILLPSFSCRDGEQETHNKNWNPAVSGILEMSRGQ